MWTGDKVGYAALHGWIKRRFPKPELCQDCGLVPPYDLSNKGVYDRNLDNWEWICRKCHMVKDGRMKNLNRNGTKPKTKVCGICNDKHKSKGLCSKHYQQSRYVKRPPFYWYKFQRDEFGKFIKS